MSNWSVLERNKKLYKIYLMPCILLKLTKLNGKGADFLSLQKKKSKKVGYLFLGLTLVFYILAGITVISPLDLKIKGIFIAVFIAIAELSFLGAIIFLGKELVKKYKSYLNSVNWFKKKKNKDKMVENVKEGKVNEQK